MLLREGFIEPEWIAMVQEIEKHKKIPGFS
jgi:hypothetical protein